MKGMHKLFFVLLGLMLCAANAGATRWLTRDPMDIPQHMERDPFTTFDFNPYAFVGNSSVNRVDPNGLWWWDAGYIQYGVPQLTHDLFYGADFKDPAPAADTQLALDANAGIGPTPLTDGEGNTVKPGDLVQDTVLSAAAQVAMLPVGGPEDKTLYDGLTAAEKAAEAAKAAAKCKSFPSFRALKNALPNSPGKVWHHVVEQSQAGRFGAEAIQNVNNVVEVTPEVNQSINALYSSIRPEITGSDAQTVRQWLSTQSFDQAAAFGHQALQNVTSGRWP